MLADDGVERIGGHEVLREIRRGLDDTGGDRGGDGRVCEIGGDQALQFRNELVYALRGQVQAKQLDCDELVLLGIVRTKDLAERARANLMKYAERTERVRRRGAGSFVVQSNLLGGPMDAAAIVTLNTRRSKRLRRVRAYLTLARRRVL